MKRNLLLKLTMPALMTVMGFTCLTGCAAKAIAATQVTQPAISEVTALANVSANASVPQTNIKTEDTDITWDAATATLITLNSTSVTINGTGATSAGSIITISNAGTYVVSGKLTNGQIAVAATSNDTVQIILNGAEITNLTGAPIYASQCDKLIITLAEGTTNSVTDGGNSFVYADKANEEPNAAIFSKDDLTINGSGTLTVNAGFNNGIGTKDDLIVANGNLIINAANHGLRGNDSVTVLNGTFLINAGNDGIQTSNGTDADKGWIAIEGGTFTLLTAHDGIQAETVMYISAGTFDITTGGGVTKTQSISASETTSDSYKAIKAGTDMIISGGDFTIDSADDAVHSNANITITGGDFVISSGDDGVHADGDLTINGGDIYIITSYEGLEANTMTIADGVINLTATDDGINISGGNDTSGRVGRFGTDSFSSAGSRWLKINGGTITVVAGSDGIDINGSGEMTGGTVNVTAGTMGEGQTIDSDGVFNRTGGSLTESGGTTMGGGGGKRR